MNKLRMSSVSHGFPAAHGAREVVPVSRYVVMT